MRRLRVFCARIGRSLDLETCSRCPAFLEVVPDATEHGRVECRADGPGPLGVEPEATCAVEPQCAGAAAISAPPCVREEVLSGSVARLLDETGAPFVLVVDANEHVVGAVWPAAAVDAEASGRATAAEVMTNARTAGEATSLRTALLQMASSHLRWIAIVADDGTPVGVLRDVDALTLWAERRRRPP